MALTEQGKKTLIEVAEWLEAGAPHVKIGNGRKISKFDMTETVNVNDCGTACCIAGAIHQFEGFDIGSNGLGWVEFYGLFGLKRQCQEFLNINDQDATSLFEPWCYFEDYDQQEFSQPDVAAKVIRRFVETGHIEWGKVIDEKNLNGHV